MVCPISVKKLIPKPRIYWCGIYEMQGLETSIRMIPEYEKVSELKSGYSLDWKEVAKHDGLQTSMESLIASKPIGELKSK